MNLNRTDEMFNFGRTVRSVSSTDQIFDLLQLQHQIKREDQQQQTVLHLPSLS